MPAGVLEEWPEIPACLFPTRALVDVPGMPLALVGVRHQNRPSASIDELTHLTPQRLGDVRETSILVRDSNHPRERQHSAG
jgi:hypothetical protein